MSMHMKIYPEEKLRFRVEKDDLSFVIDQIEEEGGTNQGPTPVEILVGSLGGCVATMIGYYCTDKGIDFSGMVVEVDWVKEKNPYRVSEIKVKVNFPGETDRKLQKILERVAHTCIIHQTLTTPPKIDINFPWTKQE